MALRTVTIRVRDFDLAGDPPANASVDFSRLTITGDGETFISTAVKHVPLTNGDGTVQLRDDTGYRVDIRNIAGLDSPFWILVPPNDSNLVTLWRTQVSDTALLPIPPELPSAVDVLTQALAALNRGAGGALSGDYPNPGFNSTALDQAIAARINAPTSQTATSLAAAYLAMRATEPSAAERAAGVVAYVDKSVIPPALKGWNGSAWVPLGSSSGTTPGDAFTDNGDGTYTPSNFTVTDAGDGTWTSTGTVTDLGDGTFNLAA